MKSQFKIYAAMAAIAAGAAFAQTVPATPAMPVPATPAAPAVPAPEAEQSALTETPAVAEPVEPAPVPEPAPTPEPVAIAVETVAPATPKEPIKIKFGIRPAIGISAFRGHKALDFGEWKLQMHPALSFGLGAAADIQFNSLVSLAVELQYTQYRADNEFAVKTGADFHNLNEAGITLHALELPVLARFNIANAYYAEVGPQVGYNARAVIYKNSDLKQPELNAIAFGPVLGGGIKLNGGNTLLGIRCSFGLLEYAENSKGYPWTVQASATQFLF
jgi:hypothetical protein